MLAEAAMLKYCNNVIISNFQLLCTSSKSILVLFSGCEAGEGTFDHKSVDSKPAESTRVCDLETLWVQCIVGWALKDSQQTG